MLGKFVQGIKEEDAGRRLNLQMPSQEMQLGASSQKMRNLIELRQFLNEEANGADVTVDFKLINELMKDLLIIEPVVFITKIHLEQL
jgi:hypothetical protein